MSKKPLEKKKTIGGVTLPVIGWIIVAIVVVGIIGTLLGAGQ